MEKLSLYQLRAAKGRIVESYPFGTHPNINGIGIGDGFVQINLQRKTKDKFPKHVTLDDGTMVPVQVRVVGVIRPAVGQIQAGKLF